MFEDIFSRRNLIIKKIVDFFIEETNRDIILETILKVKDVELIFRSIILFSKSNYLGIYSLEHRKKLLDLINDRKKEDFSKFFFKCDTNFMKKYNLEKYLKYEVLTLNYMYEKKYLNVLYEINESNYLKSKKVIYNEYGESTKIKYFNYKNLIKVKKGKGTLDLNIQEILYHIYKKKNIEYSMKKYILKYYEREYYIISEYLKYYKEMLL